MSDQMAAFQLRREVERLVVVRLGTRGSELARWQTDHVAGLLRAAWPQLRIEIEVMRTRGDAIVDTPLPLLGGKGLFTEELENALLNGSIDLAVHSLKDLPVSVTPGLIVGAVPPRANVADVVVSRSGLPLASLPAGAGVGTSSTRRSAQLQAAFPHLQPVDIRGNVDTRLRKALDPHGPYDAILLAAAGLERLGRGAAITEMLPPEIMLPAPGQGALAVQCGDSAVMRALLAPLEHAATRCAVTAERAFLQELGGGCSVPVAALAVMDDDGALLLKGRVLSNDGRRRICGEISGPAGQAAELGAMLASSVLAQGAAGLLAQGDA